MKSKMTARRKAYCRKNKSISIKPKVVSRFQKKSGFTKTGLDIYTERRGT